MENFLMFTLLISLHEESNEGKRTGAAAVYHRDYLKTRNKPYRKYKKAKGAQ